MDRYIIEEGIIPYLNMLDDISLLDVACISLTKICKNNMCEKNENGDIIHPCLNDCFVKRTIGCTELFNMQDLLVRQLKEMSKNE